MVEQSDQDAWERSPGFVYFIAAGNAIKIGISKETKLLDRYSSIQSSNHEPLRLLGVIPFRESERPMKDAEKHEKELHKKFEQFRCKGAGSEWFNAQPEIKKYIENEAMAALKLAIPDTDKIWTKFQANVGEKDRKFVKCFHDAMVSSSYISTSKNTLHFRLSYSPNETVAVIRIGSGSDLEIYLNHSDSFHIEELIKEHVTLDNIKSKFVGKKYPRFKLHEWIKPPHYEEFLTAFEQIARKSREESQAKSSDKDFV